MLGSYQFYEDEFISEIGHSFEQAVFGGGISPVPLHIASRPETIRNMVGHGLTTGTWPSSRDARTSQERDRNYVVTERIKDDPHNAAFVTPFFASALMSEKYWQNTVLNRKKSHREVEKPK